MNEIIQRKTSQPRLTKKHHKILSLCLLVASASFLALPDTAVAKNQHSAPSLFEDSGVQQSAKKSWPAKAHKAKKNRSVKVRTDLLWSETLTLNLFDDVTVTAVRDRMIDNVKGNSTWIGHIDGEPDSEVFLTVRGKTMSGKVLIGSDVYEIEVKSNNKHEITKIDPANNPVRDDTRIAEDFLAAGNLADSTPVPEADIPPSADGAGTIIDLMVVYTAKAKNNAAGQPGIESKIANAVAMANQAYINSHIDMQLNLVYTGEINYAETGNMSTSLSDLTGSYDGKMDTIHAMRNQYGADQVVLITADANYCGIGYVMTYPDVSFAPYAFSVVHDDSVYACLSNNTLAHELGHNQGNQHDRDSSSSQGAFSFSYGYRLCQVGGFRTVMSYACTGGNRVSYFSNPNVLYNGMVTGTATENNALSMTNTKAIVAAFRGAVSKAIPATPSNLTATALSATEISLTWSDGSSDETGFRLERSVDGINWTEFAVTAGNTTRYIDSGLVAATVYQYRIRSYNSNGNSEYSNIGSAITSSIAVDTTPPVVSILKPIGGARISGTVTISVNATDNVKVSNLRLYIDGRMVSAGNTGFLSYSWNTRRISYGLHTISAQAIDSSNNIGRQSVSVSK